MKLRRALVTAAATAAMAPLALMSAPAAFADGEPTATVTTSPTDTVSPSASETTPAETTTATPSPTDTTAGTTPTTAAPSPTTATPTPTATATETETASPTATPTSPGDEDVPYCDEVDEDYGQARVSAAISGLPGKIVAGSGFHGFDLKVTNDSKADVEGVAFYAEVENYEIEDESKFLSPYVNLQFKNPDSGEWERIGSADWAGDYFFYVDKLKAGQSAKVALRLSIAKNAPAGSAYSFGSGAYLDSVKGQDCIAEGWAAYDFQVLKPGSENPDPGHAEPGDKGGKGGDKTPNLPKPDGDVSELPGGSLAETGSSSMLPTVGLVGGLAVAAGAGAVFVVRRRKAGAVA